MLRERLFLDKDAHLLRPVLFDPSPHHDARPAESVIDTVIIHGISLPPGEFGTGVVPAFFCGRLDFSAYPTLDWLRDVRVSAHLLIERSGSIVQFVPFDQRAWHAGISYFDGRAHCNDFSIGIELEGTDVLPYEMAQYTALADVLQLLMSHYNRITPERIVGHSDVAPGRKTDPGPFFDWDLIRGLLS
jgi:AmpD protein